MDCEDHQTLFQEPATEISSACHGETTANEEDNVEQNNSGLQMTLEDIELSMKQMIEEINNKRENDLAILKEVKKEIMAQAQRSCEILDQQMADMHAAKGKEIDEKYESLAHVINKIKESHAEIEKTKSSLTFLCKNASDHES